ncbi:MAG: nuclear transport factor 2 family protein [Gammaproteobacteria bacterium]
MKDGKLELNTPDDAEAVYYEAFMRCDIDVMTALWADGDVICVHPGSGVIVGHAAVRRSWAHIFTNAQMPEVNFSVVKRSVSEDLAVHLVTEEIASGAEHTAVVLATNVYQRFASGWLMIEHHASLVRTQPRGHTLQ